MNENICYALWQLSLRDCGWWRRWYFVRLEGHTIWPSSDTAWEIAQALCNTMAEIWRYGCVFAESFKIQIFSGTERNGCITPMWLPATVVFHWVCQSRVTTSHSLQSIRAVIDAFKEGIFHCLASSSISLFFSVICTALRGIRVLQLS